MLQNTNEDHWLKMAESGVDARTPIPARSVIKARLIKRSANN